MNRSFLFTLIGHLLLAIAAFFMVGQTAVLFPQNEITFSYQLALTFGTLSVYRLAYLGLRWPFGFSSLLNRKEVLLMLVIPLLFIPFLKLHEMTGLIIMVILCFAYFVEVGKWKGLRTIPVLKSIWVALVWTITTAVIPLLKDPDLIIYQFITERFLFMLALCIIYNLRDMPSDIALGLKTLPHKIGVKRTKQLAIAFLILNEILVVTHEYQLPVFLALSFSLIITAIIVLLAKEGGHMLYYSLAVDATMILQSVLVIGAVSS